MESLVARPATTYGNAHLTIKWGSALITVTATSGLILLVRIAAGPPAPPQPITTNLFFALITALLNLNKEMINNCFFDQATEKHGERKIGDLHLILGRCKHRRVGYRKKIIRKSLSKTCLMPPQTTKSFNN
jgi:hypothetical protein